MKVIDYALTFGADPADVVNNVKQLTLKGWQPLGGIAYGRHPAGVTVWMQAMVLYENETEQT